MSKDIFICHASEDKAWVRQLAEALRNRGLKVWFDEFELTIGDSLFSESKPVWRNLDLASSC